MFELLIDKVIGEDWWAEYTGVSEEISARYVRETLAAFPANETELKITIDSPGGDVFEGITIYNIIRDFARSNPEVKIRTYIQGMAASMASVIALAANSVNSRNTIEAEDNAVYMIHDAWDVVFGNQNDLREAAAFLEQIDAVLRAAYVNRTGKSSEEIRRLMDAETWFWGNEIKEAGFADEIIEFVPDEGMKKDIANGLLMPEDKDSCVISAKQKFFDVKKTMQQVHAHAKKDRSFGAAARALGFKGGTPSGMGPVSSIKNKKGGCMKVTAEELKRDNPEVYAQILADGEKAGIEKEQARVSRLLALGEKSGAKDFALSCVKDGSNPSDEKIIDTFMEKGAAAKALAAQEADGEVPDVNPPKNEKNADLNAVMAAFDRETGAEKWEK